MYQMWITCFYSGAAPAQKDTKTTRWRPIVVNMINIITLTFVKKDCSLRRKKSYHSEAMAGSAQVNSAAKTLYILPKEIKTVFTNCKFNEDHTTLLAWDCCYKVEQYTYRCYPFVSHDKRETKIWTLTKELAQGGKRCNYYDVMTCICILAGITCNSKIMFSRRRRFSIVTFFIAEPIICDISKEFLWHVGSA